MTIDPDDLNDRTSTASPNDLKMLDHPDQSEDNEEMGTMADIDPKLKERFDLER
jgi:hypothetical protein